MAGKRNVFILQELSSYNFTVFVPFTTRGPTLFHRFIQIRVSVVPTSQIRMCRHIVIMWCKILKL
jgi:uncharacterized membrane protein